MFNHLPRSYEEYASAPWETYQTFYDQLETHPLTPHTLHEWMSGWSWVMELLGEVSSRLYVAYVQNTTDEEAEKRFFAFLETIEPQTRAADQKLTVKLLESGLVPAGMDIPVKAMRVDADLFRDENLPLITEERKLASEYDKIAGAWTIPWDGEEQTITGLQIPYQSADRATREAIWRAADARRLVDRDAIDDLWTKMLALRVQMAQNAGFPEYRAYRWQQLHRFDYTPADNETFHRAIEEKVVPVATRIYEKRARALGVDTLRPWDLDLEHGVYPFQFPSLVPFTDVAALDAQCAVIFHKVDPQLGAYYVEMQEKGMLDLDNRKGKGPGAFCTYYPITDSPFIFGNAVGMHDDVQMLLHEAGHAFHGFETRRLPYLPQRFTGMEFAEVASMGMELLAAPYLTAEQGGFYTPQDAARARIEHLEKNLLFWPYMAVVDAFQHWAYTHADEAQTPAHRDAKWGELWARFIPGVDWSGLEDACVTGWHRKGHIHGYPFYYVEYGLAELGAVQVWANALRDQAGAVAAYRHALSLGGTAPLPELFKAAGARFAFDAETVGEAVGLMERVLKELEEI
ncbi:MAG: M3 family oligoendopeptidase [Anaerolineales bacterium]|nr:M3 family oligoendopeptidase [Anaerolineales bacterium]